MTYDPVYEKMYYGITGSVGRQPVDKIEAREKKDRNAVTRVLEKLIRKQDVVTVQDVVDRVDARRSMVNIVFFAYGKKEGFKLTLGDDRMPVSLEFVC